jgi:hypothetical protein
MSAPQASADLVGCEARIQGALLPFDGDVERHATFGNPIHLAWSLYNDCGSGWTKQAYINGTLSGTTTGNILTGSMTVTPTATTIYYLSIQFTRPDGSHSAKVVDVDTIVVGRVVSYFRSGLTGQITEDTRRSDSAITLAAKAQGVFVLNGVEEAYRQKAAGMTFKIQLLPYLAKLTELPGWTQYAGVRTASGTLYDDVRNASSVTGTFVAVGEENIIKGDTWPNVYEPGHTIAHELGHTVLNYVAIEKKAAVRSAYSNQKARDGKFISDYAKTNADEYFAEATAAWFFMPPFHDPTSYDSFSRLFVYNQDPMLYSILTEIYEGDVSSRPS